MKKTTVIGLGYVGLPLACLLARNDFEVAGLDLDEGIVKKTNNGESHIQDEFLEKELKDLKGKIKATTDAKQALKNSEIVVVCVPTPVDEKCLPNLLPLKKACQTVSESLKKNQLVIIESTIYPGTIEEVVQPILEKSGLKAGKDFFLAHCPERIDPGNKKWVLEKIPRVVGGIDEESALRAKQFYESFLSAPVKKLNSVKAAEAVKIMENTFRDVNIAFVNELAKSFDVLGIDIKEVIEGASTKPFGFMPFYPGPGVGGHCFDKNEFVYARINGCFGIFSFEEFFTLMKKSFEVQCIEGKEFVFPTRVEVLSFDLAARKSCFRPVQCVSKRFYEKSIKLTASGNYSLTVTNKHPLIVLDECGLGFAVKFADQISVNDSIILSTKLPDYTQEKATDLINLIPKDLAKNVRVKPIDGNFLSLKQSIHKPLMKLTKNARDVYRNNSMPLMFFLELEKQGLIPFSKEQLSLCTGRGPSFSSIRAVIPFNENFCRLVGYYLSEGCITKEKTLRTRLTFNFSEKELIDDVFSILEWLGIGYSIHKDKKFQALTIRVSSPLFSFLLKDVLSCGTNCYNMSVPSQIMFSSSSNRLALLAGLLRGDGGVSIYFGKRHYSKNGRKYFHQNNSIAISFFSSSHKLFQQALQLLLDCGFTPSLAKRKGNLLLFGKKNASRAQSLFDGEKKAKINSYLQNQVKAISLKTMQVFQEFALLPVKKIESVTTNDVYSVEVEGTSTLITSNSIVAHNCIAVDPYYLIERAKQNGFDHTFLRLARKINDSMPDYVLQIVTEGLNHFGKSIKNSRIAVLGIAYKANVDDSRESPSFHIIKLLRDKGAVLKIFDPLAQELNNSSSIEEAVSNADCVVVATSHNEFLQKITPEFLKQHNISFFVDCRNAFNKKEFKQKGIFYKGIGS